MAWDLRNDLAEVPSDEDNAYFTTNVKLLKEVRELRAAADVDTDLLERKEKELKAATYTVEMMSVPRRRRNDIYEESLDKFQAKLSLLPNQVDDKTQFQRGNYVRIAVVAAGIKRIISPNGDAQEEGIADTVQYLYDEAPGFIFDILEKKAEELNAKQDEQDDLHQSADF